MLHAIDGRTRHLLVGTSGMTAVELMVAGILASIVTLAAVSMYFTSVDAWEQSGAKLAVQRNADLVLERIASDIRRGSRVSITGGTSMSIYRVTASGDSLVVSYSLVGDVLKNNSDVTLLENVAAVVFSSSDNTKALVSIELLDDLGTPTIDVDDARIYLRTTAVCRFPR